MNHRETDNREDDDIDAMSAGELMDECAWVYDASADTEPERGPKRHHDGYSIAAYFAIDSERTFASREAALDALHAAYLGPDSYGVGLELPDERLHLPSA